MIKSLISTTVLKRLFCCAVIGVLYLGSASSCSLHSTSPYPPSTVISDVQWDWSSHIRMAPGSDLWPVTWGPDGHLYTSWGDGGGFGGDNKDGRASLGFARLEGNPPDVKGINIWGGKNAATPPVFGGKCPALLSVDGILYAWVNLQNRKPPDQQLFWSDDLAHTWNKVEWFFPGDGAFFPNCFLNFGQDYSDAPDSYIYTYGNDRSDPQSLFLAKVPKDQIKIRSAYLFFAGFESTGQPIWSPDVDAREPVARNRDGIGATAASYIEPLGRYILTAHHGNYAGRFGIFDAPEPWGPWTTAVYYNDWNRLGDLEGSMPHSIPTKWIESNGESMWMIFSSRKRYDSFNLIRLKVSLRR